MKLDKKKSFDRCCLANSKLINFDILDGRRWALIKFITPHKTDLTVNTRSYCRGQWKRPVD